MKGKIVINSELCKGCRFCITFCTKGGIALANKLNAKGYCFAEHDEKKGCTGCAVCALMCPEAAIEVYRE
ncbi:MAG: hypothetical protein WCQ99_10630 [Pseudomonadota bacterium]